MDTLHSVSLMCGAKRWRTRLLCDLEQRSNDSKPTEHSIDLYKVKSENAPDHDEEMWKTGLQRRPDLAWS